MKTLACLTDLRAYGIDLLTGESCAYGYRALCDLNERGVKTVCEYFGIREVGLAENWNSGAIRSMMISYQEWKGLAVFSFLLWEPGLVIETTKSVFSLEENERIEWVWEDNECTAGHYSYSRDELTHPWFSDLYGKITRILFPKNSSRNLHQFTGRIS